MQKIVVASTRRNAGKTSTIIGLAEASNKQCGYLKPLGDRLLYRKKRLWDYDSELLTYILNIGEKPEDISLGFEHAKLRYMYDAETTKAKLLEKAETVAAGKDLLLVEAGSEIHFGASVHVDALSLARALDAKLLLVLGGGEDDILDDLHFLKRNIDMNGIDFVGAVINKIKDMEDFQATYVNEIENAGVKVLGLIPYKEELTHMPISYLVDLLFAKVIAGEGGLNRIAKNIFVGAMSVNTAIQNPMFKKQSKLIITSGDRSDMILAALESDTSCIVLTNNILPPSNIISKAEHANVPLLLVPWDTYRTAMQIDLMDPLLTKNDKKKVDLVGKLIKDNVKIDQIL